MSESTPPEVAVRDYKPVERFWPYVDLPEQARASAELRDHGSGPSLRHRARFYPQDVLRLHALFEVVGRFDSTEVLIDDQPVPYARELWLPLLWFLIK